jgi:hypothetical protein
MAGTETLVDMQKRGVIGDESARVAVAKKINSGEWTLARVLDLKPGTALIEEDFMAAKAIAEAADLNAGRIRKLAMQGLYDETEALDVMLMAAQATVNVSAVISEAGRVVRLGAKEGEIAGAQAIIGRMPLDPSGGGITDPLMRLKSLRDQLIKDAGGARMALDQIEGLKTKAQRDALGGVWIRRGHAFLEDFYTKLFWIGTSVKVVISGPITAGYDLVTTGAGEGIRRMANAIAPEHVSDVVGFTRGTTWAGFQGLRIGLQRAVQSVVKTWDALERIAKAEGVIKAEQSLTPILQQTMPEWGEATKSWNRGAQMTAENVELSGLFGRVVDIYGAAARGITTDPLQLGHGLSYTINYWMGAARRAHELAVEQGLKGEAHQDFFRREMNDPSPDVHAAATETARRNTFIRELTPPMQGLSAPMRHAVMKVLVAPVTRIPLSIFQFTMEGTPVFQNISIKWWKDVMAGGAAADAAWGKMAVGWAGLLTLMDLAEQGYITGDPPRNLEERKAGENAGIAWNSIYFPATGQWVSHRALEPISSWLTIAANMVRIARDMPDDQLHKFVIPLFIAAGEDFINKPIMQGLSRWVDVAMNWSANPDQAMRDMTRALEPPILPVQATLQRAQRAFGDDLRRDAREWVTHYMSIVYPDAAPPHRHMITGEPFHYEGAWGGSLISPLTTMTPSDDRVDKELWRLRGAGLKPLPDHMAGASPSEYLGIQIPGKVPGVKLSAEQRDRWIVLMTQQPHGGKTLHEAMDDLIASPLYDAQSDVTKISMLQDIWNTYRDASQEALLADDKALAAAVKGQQEERLIQRMPTAQQPAARERAGIVGLGR